MQVKQRFFQGLLVLILVSVIIFPVQAQTNLLQNGEFDGIYHGAGTAAYWESWSTNQPKTEAWMNIEPFFFPNTGQIKRSGDASQTIVRDGGTFTAAVWQRVDNIPQGTALRATAWVYYENGPGTNARVRIGIGSNTVDPINPTITWGGWMSNYNSWQQISVDAVVPAGSVTVFIYATQDFPNGGEGRNQVYIEDATLVVTGAGAVPTQSSASGGGVVVPVPTSTPLPAVAPAVSVQDTDPSDGITHVVRSGDTLAAIAVAYGTRTSVLRELNNLPQGSIIQPGQVIIVALPPKNSASAQPTAAAPAQVTPQSVTAQSTVPATQPAAPPTAASTATSLPPTSEPAAVEPTLDVTWTPSPVPPTPTPAATAAVTAGADGNPVLLEAGVCVTLFNDKNQNRLQSGDEPYLAGGEIRLVDRAGTDIGTRTTTADGEPACFVDIVPGNYSLSAIAPDGYGLTTPATLSITVQAGTQFQISFGAAQGVTVATAPTPDNQVIGDAAGAQSGGATTPADPRSLLGIIFIGLAGVVLVGGIVLSVIIRRL